MKTVDELVRLCKGDIIAGLKLDKETNRFVISFKDCKAVEIFDGPPCCCEHRYMSCDDELSYFIGAEFLGIEFRGAKTGSEDTGCLTEYLFLDIQTSKGSFQLVNHNVHNGYYGGFNLDYRIFYKSV